MNTAEAIIRLKSGLLNTLRFQQQQSTKRVKSLHLSTSQDVENVHGSGINSIDLEKVDSR